MTGPNPTTASAPSPHAPAVTPSGDRHAQSASSSTIRSSALPSSAAAPAAPPASAGADQAGSSPAVATSTASNKPLPPLPAPEPATAGNGGEATTIEVNGARVSLADQLGPAVVNADGTMSRIANWGEMSEIERRNTVRVLGKRNKLRLEALREGGGG